MTETRRFASQFSRVQIQCSAPKTGFDMWVAVWTPPSGVEIVIGAPTLAQLEQSWEAITHTPLDTFRAHHVVVTRFPAPETLYEAARSAVATARKGRQDGQV